MRCAGRAAAGLGWFGQLPGKCFGILTYHRVCPDFPELAATWHNVPPQRFQQQLQGLLDRGFRCLPLGEVIDRQAQGKDLPPRTFVITFDDGFAAVYHWAWPVLKQLQLPATIFLNTQYLDQDAPFPFDGWGLFYPDRAPLESFRPLTTAECLAMTEDGQIELAAHTHTHADYRGAAAALEADLRICLRELEQRFNVVNPTFAFPYGSPRLGYADQELVDRVQKLGMRCALTTAPERVAIGSSPFGWGRFNAFPWDSASTLAGKLAGWYSWAPRFKQRLVG
jgi:peptidoglycan/xylan/chitin deacetylase (PgdA/CDA1 family)